MKFIVSVLVLVLASFACGGSGGPPTEPPSDDKMNALLLTLANPPAGYKAPVNFSVSQIEDVTAVCDLEDAVQKADPSFFAIEYTKTDANVSVTYMTFKGNAEQTFDTIASVLKGCTQWREGSERIGTTHKITPLEVPKLGGEAIGVNVLAENQPIIGTSRGDIIYARYGQVILIVGNAGIKAAANIDPELTKSTAIKAMDNLRAIK